MRILLLNGIMWTADNGVIKQHESIRDCMMTMMARGFVAAGHDVTLVTAEDFRPRRDDEDVGCPVVYLPTRCRRVFQPAYIPWVKGLRRFLRERIDDVDMVLVSEVFSMMALQAAGVAGKKLVIWQELYFHQHKFFTLASRLWHNTVARFALRDALIVPRSEQSRRFIARYCRHVSDDVVDHGADGTTLYPSDSVDDRFIVVSQLVPRKHIDKIVDIMARLVAREPYRHYRLDIAGDGICRADIERQIARLGLTDNVTMHGHISHSDMADMLRRARALLIFTEKDLNMVSIPEAIISGTPIVTNSVPSNSYIVARHNLGIVRDNWDEQALIDIIDNYDTYHRACVNYRDQLTNTGTAKRIVDIFSRQGS